MTNTTPQNTDLNMDKNNYETYEYLPVNSNETDQFFIVQDDGTFLINRAIQYVPPVQNGKPVLDNVVYDVAPQQYLVDVENTPELVSVSDQFILPDGGNQLYTNGYLIQPEANGSPEQMEQDVAVAEFKHTEPILDLDVVAQSSKQANNCTEITLNDEQYHMLEQKGWILLETNDKIYLLDTLGLHDITTNDKLIQKLKIESEDHLNQDSKNMVKLESISALENNIQTNVMPLTMNNEMLQEENSVEDNVTFEESKTQGRVIYNEQNIEGTTKNICHTELKLEDAVMKSEELIDGGDNGTRVLVIDNDDIRREGSTLKVKTKLSLRNLPEKIVLGRTVNGKRLIARVVKPKSNNRKSTQTDDSPNANSQTESVQERKWDVDKSLPAIHLGNLLTESEFHMLIKHLFQTNDINKCNAEDVVAADSVIAQLLQLPAFKATVVDSNLVVTKTVQSEDSSGKILQKSLTAVLTGKVTLVDGEWHFVHLPYMLQKIMNDTEDLLANGETTFTNKRVFDVLHVQIFESKQTETNLVKVSVTVNKRSIPMNLIPNTQKLQPNTMYACSACASLFKSEELLLQHQVNDCLEPESTLLVDLKPTDSNSNEYTIVEGKTKSYICNFCNVNFNKLATMKKHIRTHCVPDIKENGDKSQNENNAVTKIYKCNMCPSSYFHPSTLSKHILSRHIKIKT